MFESLGLVSEMGVFRDYKHEMDWFEFLKIKFQEWAEYKNVHFFKLNALDLESVQHFVNYIRDNFIEHAANKAS